MRGAALEWRGVCRLFAPLRIVATAQRVVAACAEGQCACTPPGTEAVPHALPSTTPSTMGTPSPLPLRKRNYLFFRLSINIRLLLHPL